ncbi:hypothetical protein C8R44DRAFT_751912 [Mycena epipterygia]|nr:hypothetical protein C8R44DRAFT_751912 [Mycena epipterygia]
MAVQSPHQAEDLLAEATVTPVTLVTYVTPASLTSMVTLSYQDCRICISTASTPTESAPPTMPGDNSAVTTPILEAGAISAWLLCGSTASARAFSQITVEEAQIRKTARSYAAAEHRISPEVPIRCRSSEFSSGGQNFGSVGQDMGSKGGVESRWGGGSQESRGSVG